MGISPGQRVVLADLFNQGAVADGAQIVQVTAPNSGLMRVTVAFSSLLAALRVVEGDGVNTVNLDFNAGSALTLGALYVFEFDVIGGNTYNFVPSGNQVNVDRFSVSVQA